MAWIKRNLIFVICLAVGVALMGLAVFLLISSLGENQEASDKFQQAVSELKALQDKNPSPTPENIAAAKEAKEHMKDMIADFRKSFAAFPVPPKTDDKDFKAYLQSTVAELQAKAAQGAVQLPTNYAFSFSSQMEKLNLSADCIQPWMEQLEEIKGICGILYGAKINYLEGLQRVPVCRDDGTGPDYLSATSVTNQNGVLTPYKVSFRGFSAEVAAVLEGFERSSNCFIVKNIDVTPSKVQPGTGTFASVSAAMAATPIAQRPIPQRGSVPPAPGAPASAPARTAPGLPPVPILGEKQLFVTLTVDVLKLKTAER